MGLLQPAIKTRQWRERSAACNIERTLAISGCPQAMQPPAAVFDRYYEIQ